jgi:CheY-like chemotaxis protein
MDKNLPKKLLIVEDDFFIRNVYEVQARSEQYITILAGDGEEGLQKMRNERPDFVLLDLMLPKIDGFTVLKTVKNDPFLSDIPIMILTNLENSHIEEQARALGAVDYLFKIHTTPVNVLKVVKQYFANDQTQS